MQNELLSEASEFRSQIGWRNLRAYLVSGVLIPVNSYNAWTDQSPLMRAGNVLMVMGLIYMLCQLHRRTAPVELGLDSHRADLERQRDALQGIWKWYLGPLIPGLSTIVAAVCTAAFRRTSQAGAQAMVLAGLVGAALWWLARVNQKEAADIGRQIQALD